MARRTNYSFEKRQKELKKAKKKQEKLEQKRARKENKDDDGEDPDIMSPEEARAMMFGEPMPEKPAAPVEKSTEEEKPE